MEWPHVLLGSIDAEYMELPWQVRATTMRANQKYFTLAHKGGATAPRFAIVANIPGADGGKAIIAGNERVLRARPVRRAVLLGSGFESKTGRPPARSGGDHFP